MLFKTIVFNKPCFKYLFLSPPWVFYCAYSNNGLHISFLYSLSKSIRLSNSNRSWKCFAEANLNSAILTLEICTESLIIVEIPNYPSRQWMKFAWGSLLFAMLEWTAVKLHSRFLRFNRHQKFFSSASEPTCSLFVYWRGCLLTIVALLDYLHQPFC